MMGNGRKVHQAVDVAASDAWSCTMVILELIRSYEAGVNADFFCEPEQAD